MTDKLRAIPRQLLCLRCLSGLMSSYGSNTPIKSGPMRMLVYRRCDNCGHQLKALEDRVGIPAATPARESKRYHRGQRTKGTT